MRYMALDVGQKRIGVAVSDPLGWTVQPLTTLESARKERDFESIAQIIHEFTIKTIVIGVPLRTEEGELGWQAKKILKFADELGAYCRASGLHVAIETWDESMSTHEAHEMLSEMGATNKQRKERVDQLAAVVILQSYLDAQKESS